MSRRSRRLRRALRSLSPRKFQDRRPLFAQAQQQRKEVMAELFAKHGIVINSSYREYQFCKEMLNYVPPRPSAAQSNP